MKTRADLVDGITYVLPSDEPKSLLVKRVGPFAFGLNCRLSSFGIGIDVLRSGVMIGVGPFFAWFVHVERFELRRYEP